VAVDQLSVLFTNNETVYTHGVKIVVVTHGDGLFIVHNHHRSIRVAVARDGSVRVAAVINGAVHPFGVVSRIQVGFSYWQLAQQPSDHKAFPSSHCSPACTTPSPHH